MENSINARQSISQVSMYQIGDFIELYLRVRVFRYCILPLLKAANGRLDLVPIVDGILQDLCAKEARLKCSNR